MKKAIALLLCICNGASFGQEVKQECYTRIINPFTAAAAPGYGNAWIAPYDASISAIDAAIPSTNPTYFPSMPANHDSRIPTAAYITRACIFQEEGGVGNFPCDASACSYGSWSIGIDRGGAYTAANNYPYAQNVPTAIRGMHLIGRLDIRAGGDKGYCMSHNPPIKFTAYQDKLILNWYSGGGFPAYPTINICWKVTE